MQETNQKLTGFAAEIRLIAGWAWALAAIGFLAMQYVFNVVVAQQPDAPPAWARPLIGLSVGLVVAFYFLMIGYVSRDFRLVARWAWILAVIGFLSMQFVFNVVVARQHDAPPAWARSCWLVRPCPDLLPVTGWLRESRCGTPGHEPCALDRGLHPGTQRPGIHSVLHSPPAHGGQLPAVWTRHTARVQFLPTVQLQVEPQLSTMPAYGPPGRHLLPLLWNLVV